jgi:hypothetical protein
VRNIIELRKYGLGDYSSDENKNGWTAVEFWTIVKEFTQKSVVSVALT